MKVWYEMIEEEGAEDVYICAKYNTEKNFAKYVAELHDFSERPQDVIDETLRKLVDEMGAKSPSPISVAQAVEDIASHGLSDGETYQFEV